MTSPIKRAIVDHVPRVGTVATVPPAPDTFSPDPTALDRSIVFELAFNVRDLGGLPTEDGRSIRRGLLYRGDGVHRLAGDDLEKARTLALRTVVDLRTAGEIERSGRFPVEGYPVEWHHLPIIERMWSEDDLVATTGAVDFLCDRYVDMLRSGGPSIAASSSLPPTARRCCSTARPARTAPAWSPPCC